MRIGVLSDTHLTGGVAALPPKLLEDFKNVDMIIHAGDILDAELLNGLKVICPKVLAVSGNMDSGDLKAALPEKELIKAGKFKIGVIHGWGAPNRLVELLPEKFKDDNVDMIIFGHSHSPLNEKIGKIIFFNPGSPTDKAYSPYNSYGIVDIGDTIEARIIRI